MDVFNAVVNTPLRALAALFAWAPPAVSLGVFSLLAGMGILWVVRNASNQERIRSVKREVHANLLEMRVYADDPAACWRAQKSLMGANLRYMGLALRPALWMALPLAILLVHLEAFYGRAPLPEGRSALVTAAVRGEAVASNSALRLLPPAGVEVTAPPVRILEQRQVSWRVLPARALSGEFRFVIGGQSVCKAIEVGGGQRFIAGRRVRSGWDALWHPDEPRIGPGSVEWVEIAYPETYIDVFGLRFHWLVWFLIVSMLSALLLRKRFGVTL
jgi:hypothetical protein